MKNPISFIRDTFSRLAGMHGEPRPIALGYALGVFIAASPLIGLHCFIAILISGVLRWNRFAAGIGAFHSNLLTAPLIYSSTYIIGARFLGSDAILDMPVKPVEMLAKGPEVFIILTVGGLILGIPIAIMCYCLSFMVIKRYRSYKYLKSKINESKT